ncbi:MAG: adenosylcobinamide-GDP ribazoletransferase [Spirochaetota bacterium]
MKKLHWQDEWHILLTAVMFFTRIPIGKIPYSQELLHRSRKYFPLIGYVVAAASVCACFLSLKVWPPLLSVLLSCVVSILLTGGFHEDGWIDSCDSFGGGWTPEKILTIMKDSRIGSYGTIGFFFLVSLKIASLYAILGLSRGLFLFAVLGAHTTSRFMASCVAQNYDYVRDIDSSKSKPIASAKLAVTEMLVSFAITLLPYLVLSNGKSVLLLLVNVPFVAYLAEYFKKHIGGYTGDCLGAVQQFSEVVFYLSVLALWKYI